MNNCSQWGKNAPMNSTLYQLADKVLDGQLAQKLRLWSEAGVSRRSARYLLTQELGVEVSDVTVSRWMKEATR